MARTRTLRRRLVTTSAAVVTAFVLLGLWLTVTLTALSGSLGALHHRAAHGIEVIHEVEIELGNVAQAALLLTYNDDAGLRAEAMAALEDALAEAAEEIEELQDTVVDSDTDQAHMDRIQASFAEHASAIDRHIATIAAGDRDAAVAAVPDLHAGRAVVSENVEAFMEHIEETADAIHDDAVATISRTNAIAYAVFLGVSIVALWVMRRQAATVSQQVGRSAGSLTRSSAQLATVARSMAVGAEQTADRSSAVSAGAEQVSTNVSTVATAVEELTASVDEIGRSTSEATGAVGQAVQQAAAAGETVNALGTASNEIGDVIELIDAIAEQTNLLALNATIEAARAGEAGKGFAVVANEVKELAGQTSKATDDIRARIGAIQDQSGSAVEAIVSIQEIVRRIDDLQGVIASAIEEQAATTREIAGNVGEAAAGSAEISERVSGVADLAGATSAGAAETLATAAELRQLAHDLESLVGGEGDASPARPASPSGPLEGRSAMPADEEASEAGIAPRELTTTGA